MNKFAKVLLLAIVFAAPVAICAPAVQARTTTTTHTKALKSKHHVRSHKKHHIRKVSSHKSLGKKVALKRHVGTNRVAIRHVAKSNTSPN